MDTNPTITKTEEAVMISPIQMLAHWQGHRALTRKLIEVFPEKEFYELRIGGMRTFAELCMELIDIAGPGVKGMATGDWHIDQSDEDMAHSKAPETKKELLALWDAGTETIDQYWPRISLERFQEQDVAFGRYPGPVYGMALYFIDNEIHHRGQAYVYLRSLGIEPPAFWDRPN
ncbi:putative damage-inducible protein DinB [Dyadobacter jejuensis]|uniref:Putative damage-inducible protein DinB n=1 Tax=Dyadobacter jejuensis TaxID=1082580 RepID=A0A316AD20_9BACT|nr:DinB family protein [Dyadobacter jejuensis]PWJ54784.1 putative damage-inducible protein DinB [Dyadobacter jejuensis]